MTATRPIALPETLAAGDAWRVSAMLPLYAPADGYTATLFLRGPSTLNLPGEAGPDGAWVFVLSAANSAGAQPGLYAARIRVVKDGTPTTIGATSITVAPNFEHVGPDQLLTHEEKCLPLLEAAIAKRITVDLVSYQIINRSATKEQLTDMQRLLEKYRETVRVLHGGEDGFFRTFSVTF